METNLIASISRIISTRLTHGICVTELIFQPGETTEKHFHEETTEIYIVSVGTGIIICKDTRHEIGPSSSIVIDTHTPHQIINTGSIPLIVFSVKDRPLRSQDYVPV
jgi:mannose-6-phosphate isomerase-like protein (cupin superfamily)